MQERKSDCKFGDLNFAPVCAEQLSRSLLRDLKRIATAKRVKDIDTESYAEDDLNEILKLSSDYDDTSLTQFEQL